MKDESQDKRTAALKATLELISERGFHGAPMSQIAQRANIGVGTIYRYFSSKDDLINALYIDIKTRMTRGILGNYSTDIPVRDSFKQLLNDIIRYFVENPAVLSYMEQYENSPVITEATRQEVVRMAGPVNDLFRRATEQSLLKELPFEVLAALIYSAMVALVKLSLSGTVTLDQAFLNRGIDAIWDMIKR